MRAAPLSFSQARAINQQGRGVDVDGAVRQRGLRELHVRQRRAEQIARRRALDHLVERAARHAERGGGHGRAENVERRHRDLEAFARAAETIGQRNAAAGEAKRRQRVRRDDLDAAGDLETGRVRVDDEGGKPLGAGRLAGAREHDVVVGDPAVGNPGLHTVNAHVRRPIQDRGRC